jgi:hypothetical protein
MSNPSFDNGIPELTEVIPATPAPTAVTPPALNRAAPAVTAAPTPTTPQPVLTRQAARLEPSKPAPLASLTNEEWRRLESEIRERISLQLLGRVDYVLEQRVRDSLADVLQTAVEGLSEQIKLGLHDTLKDVISRAVSQEITRLKTTKN